MRSIYLLAYTSLFLLHFVRAELLTSCENLTVYWKLTSFSQGRLLASKEPDTQVITSNHGHKDSVMSIVE